MIDMFITANPLMGKEKQKKILPASSIKTSVDFFPLRSVSEGEETGGNG